MYVHDMSQYSIKVATFHAQHMTKSVHTATRWVILQKLPGEKKGSTSKYQLIAALNPATNAICLQSPQRDHIQLDNITGDKAEPASTIMVQMTIIHKNRTSYSIIRLRD